MEEENFIRAFQFLDDGYVVTSTLTGRRFKKTNEDYYWCEDVESSKRGEWEICKIDEKLFTSGEIKSTWNV